MVGCDLTSSHLHYASLNEAELANAVLVGAHFYWTDFSKAKFFSANLPRAVGAAKFTDADLSYSTLHKASLRGSTFVRTKVVGADVAGADLSEVTFGSMTVGDFKNLHLAILSDRQREKYGAAIENCRVWAETEAAHIREIEAQRGDPSSGRGEP